VGLFRTLFGRWNERQVPAGGDVGKMVGGGGGGEKRDAADCIHISIFSVGHF